MDLKRTIIVGIAIYLCIAFVLLEWNFVKWMETDRVVFIALNLFYHLLNYIQPSRYE